MKLGINSLFLSGFDFEDGLRLSHQLGAQAIEIATLGEPSRRYCDPDKLLADRGELARWLGTIGEHGLEISQQGSGGRLPVPVP